MRRFLLLLAAVLIAAGMWVKGEVSIDSCLDRGGGINRSPLARGPLIRLTWIACEAGPVPETRASVRATMLLFYCR
jgi:hypothetical protein